MKLRIIKRDSIDAVSTVVSAILAISIVIVAAVSTIFWGIPYINDLRSQEGLENAKMQFNLILDNIKDIVTGVGDNKNELSIAIGEGSLSINKNNFDRTILMYSYSNTFDFSVAGFRNKNYQCVLKINGTPIINEVDVCLINDEGEIGEKINSTYSYPNIFLEPPNFFEDKMVIFLNNSGNKLGKIWLFDSDSLIFKAQSNIGSHKLSLEKGGIVYIKNSNSKVEKLFNVYLKDNSFILHILQTLSSESFSVSGGGGFNKKISIESRGSSLQEISNKVYNLRLQLHGDNAQTWLNYLDNKYVDKFVLEDNEGLFDTLFLSESYSGVDLTFLNSIVDINKV